MLNLNSSIQDNKLLGSLLLCALIGEIMIRHPANNNLHLFYESEYLGLPVQTIKGPLITEYLELLYKTINLALNEHQRVFAFRVDLRFPEFLDTTPYLYSNSVVENFVGAFRYQVERDRDKAKGLSVRTHDTSVRYVWAREIGSFGRPHFHFVFFLNHHAYFSLGSFELKRANLFNRVNTAWASALKLPVESIRGVVEFPRNPTYKLRRGDHHSIAPLFHRASYLCKSDTKQYGNGCHCFGASRG